MARNSSIHGFNRFDGCNEKDDRELMKMFNDEAVNSVHIHFVNNSHFKSISFDHFIGLIKFSQKGSMGSIIP